MDLHFLELPEAEFALSVTTRFILEMGTVSGRGNLQLDVESEPPCGPRMSDVSMEWLPFLFRIYVPGHPRLGGRVSSG
jgi:hypothetical protein